jgi:TIR domain-containing protein
MPLVCKKVARCHNTGMSKTHPEEEIVIRPFLSYAREDRLKVRGLYDKLKASGFHPWLDKEDLLAGQVWESEIKKAIKDCHFFIACLSSKSVNKRGFVQKELKQALDVVGEFPEGQLFVVPVKLEECEVPASLQMYHHVDLLAPNGFEKLLTALQTGYRERYQEPINQTAAQRSGMAAPFPELVSIQRSFFDNITVEVTRDAEYQHQVWISTAERPEKTLLVSPIGIVKSVSISDDESCIVVDSGTASMGRHPTAFFESGPGMFVASNDDISYQCWLAVKAYLNLPNDASPGHIYCRTVFVRSKPLELVVLFPGNYYCGGKGHRLPLKRITYSLTAKKVILIEDDAQGSEANEQLDTVR